MARALVRERSLISNHPRLDSGLHALESSRRPTRWFTCSCSGLPNHPALEAELERHTETDPIGVLVLDFDGMRAANAAFANDYARGGDVLIVAVADALKRFAGPGEFAARTQARGLALEAMLDDRDVPESHRHVYRGASVGAAAREQGEKLAQTVARASVAMHERKRRDRGR
jgi:hypothetical protein